MTVILAVALGMIEYVTLSYSLEHAVKRAVSYTHLDVYKRQLIDCINDYLSMEMIVCDEEAKAMCGNTYIQNIETVNGSQFSP